MSEAANDTQTSDAPAAKPGADSDSESPSARATAAAARGRGRTQKRSAEKEAARAEDARLVGLARDGDSQAFRKLVERNQGRLYAVAFGMLRDRDDAMDAVQDAFIKSHKKLAEFEGNAAFSTWLYRICVNLCIDKKRADARRRSVDIDDVRQSDLSENNAYAGLDIAPRLTATNPLKNVTNKELGGEIGNAMRQLSEDHRTILLLREVEGHSYEEISQVLDIPRGTVMSRLFHARKNMQKLMRPFLGLEEGTDLSGGGEGNSED